MENDVIDGFLCVSKNLGCSRGRGKLPAGLFTFFGGVQFMGVGRAFQHFFLNIDFSFLCDFLPLHG